MATSKIKNLMICILIFVNLFLLGLLAADWLQTQRTEQMSMQAIQTILENNGITMEQIAVPRSERICSYAASRDFLKEESLVESLLGRVSTKQDQGGNIMYYIGEKGEGSFRGTGDFEILLNNNAVPISGDTVNTARSLLRKMGVKAEFSPELSTQSGGTYTTVVMRCFYEDMPVVNGYIHFVFTSQFLMMVTGTRFLDVQQVDTSVPILDETTLLTRFTGIVKRNGYVCNELKDITVVYLYTPDTSGGKLTPLWEIQTDAGIFYLNMTTGDEQPVT